MKVQCCFRLSTNGSVIHDTFDSITCRMTHYNDLFIKDNLKNIKNLERAYQDGEHHDDYAMTEAALLSDPNYVCCIESLNHQYDCFTKTGLVECKYTPEDKPYQQYENFILDIGRFYEVGVEITEYNQLRYTSTTPYRLLMDDAYLYTSIGRFEIPDEYLTRICGFRPDYKLYKSIRDGDQKGYPWFGWVFLDTAYGLIANDRGTLKIREVPYGN